MAGTDDGAPMRTGFDPEAEVRRLWARCGGFWQAEADVVRRYLAGPRDAASEARWLRLAAYKETRLYRELPPGHRALHDAGRAIPGMDAAAREVLDEEMAHYHAIAALVRALGAQPPGPDEVLDFPADRRLQAARAALRTSGDALERRASALVEGGGGAMYRVLAALDASPFDAQVAGVFARILDDEMDHGPAHLDGLHALLRDASDVTRLEGVLDELGRLRVAMREEMFFGG